MNSPTAKNTSSPFAYLPAIFGSLLAISSIWILFGLYTPLERIIYVIIFFLVLYAVGILLVWGNLYAYRYKNIHLVFLGLLLAGPTTFAVFNKAPHHYDRINFVFPPEFEGEFWVLGGMKGYPPLQVKDNQLYVQVPDSGIVYTSTFGDFGTYHLEDSSIYGGSNKSYSDCACTDGYGLNYSGCYIRKDKITQDSTYSTFFEHWETFYRYDGKEFNAKFFLENYITKKHERFNIEERVRMFCDRKLLSSHKRVDLDDLFETPIGIVFIISAALILLILPFYFLWHNRIGKYFLWIYMFISIGLLLINLVTFTDNDLGSGIIALLSALLVVGIATLLTLIGKIIWIRINRNHL